MKRAIEWIKDLYYKFFPIKKSYRDNLIIGTLRNYPKEFYRVGYDGYIRDKKTGEIFDVVREYL